MGRGIIYGPDELPKSDNAGITAVRDLFPSDVVLDAIHRLGRVRQDIHQAVAALDRTPADRIAWLTFGISAMPLRAGDELAAVGERLLTDWSKAGCQFRGCLISSGRVGHSSNTTRYIAVPEIDIVPVSAFREGGRKTSLIEEMTPGILNGLGPDDHIVFLHSHGVIDIAGHESRGKLADAVRGAFKGAYRVLVKGLYTQRDVALKTLATYMGKILSSRSLTTSEWNVAPEVNVPASRNLRKLENDVLEQVATLQLVLLHSHDFVWTNIRSQAGRKKPDTQNHKLDKQLFSKNVDIADTYRDFSFYEKPPQSPSERVVKRRAEHKVDWSLEDWKQMAASRALTSHDIFDICAKYFPTGWAEVNYIYEQAVMAAKRAEDEAARKSEFFYDWSAYRTTGSLVGNNEPYY